MKCEYCGKKIGLLAVRYTWVDKATKKAVHDACLKNYQNKKQEHPEPPIEQPPTPPEETAPTEKMITSKLLGAILLLIAAGFIITYFYQRFILRSPITLENGILQSILYGFSLLIGIELLTVKKQGLYNKFLLISGVILLIIYLSWVALIAFAISLW
jgi:hypothetical protein